MSNNPFLKESASGGGLTVFQRILMSKDKENQGQNQNNLPNISLTNSNSHNNPFAPINTRINKTQSMDIAFIPPKEENQKPNNVQPNNVQQSYSPIQRLAEGNSPVQHISPSPFQHVHHQAALNRTNVNPIQRMGKITITTNNIRLGKFQMNEKAMLENFTLKVTITQEDKQKFNKIRQQNRQINIKLNLGLDKSCAQILWIIQNHGLQAVSDNIIVRLKQGFEFYEFQPKRDEAMYKILMQNRQMNNTPKFIQKIMEYSCRYKLDKIITYYMLQLSKKGKKDSETNPLLYLLQDRIFLVRVYRQLYKRGRVSTLKFIRVQEQIRILKNILEYYQKNYQENEANFHQPNLALGIQIAELFHCIFIKNYKEISSAEFTNTFIPMLQILVQIFPQSHKVRSNLDKMLLQMFTKWPNEMANISGLGKIQFFFQFYGDENPSKKDISSLNKIMTKMSEMKQYDESMSRLVRQKIQSFVKQNPPSNIKQPSIQTAMQAILLISQHKKLPSHIRESSSVDKIYLIIYHNSPVAFLSLIDQPDKYQNFAFPLISRKYKNRGQQNKWISVEELNKNLPKPYSLQSDSENYIILKYLTNLVEFYCRNSFDGNRLTFEDIQVNLNHLNAGISSLVVDNGPKEYAYLRVVRLMGKYTEIYGKQLIQGKGNRKKFKDEQNKQIQEVSLNVRKTINNLINFYKKQSSLNPEQSNSSHSSSFLTVPKILTNMKFLTEALFSSSIYASANLLTMEQYRQFLNILSILSKQISPAEQMEDKFIQMVIEIYEQFQHNTCNSGTNKNTLLYKYKTYLLTIQSINRMSLNSNHKCQLIHRINNRYKYQESKINIENILQSMISYIKKGLNQQDNEIKQAIQLTLQALHIILKYENEMDNINRYQQLHATILLNTKLLIIQCLNAVLNLYQSIQHYQQANQLNTAFCPVFYCDLLGNILHILHKNKNSELIERDLFERTRKYRAEAQNKNTLIFNFFINPNNEQIEPEASQRFEQIIQKIYNQNTNTQIIKYIKVSFVEMALKFDWLILTKILEKDYILPTSKLLLSEIEKYLQKLMNNSNKTSNRFTHCLAKDQQQQYKEHICRCMNIYVGLFNFGGVSYEVREQQKMFNLIFYLMKTKNIEEQTNIHQINKYTIQMVVWTKFIYTTINDLLGKSLEIKSLMEELILFLANVLPTKSLSDFQILQVYPYLTLTKYELYKRISELCMRYSLEQKSILTEKAQQRKRVQVIEAFLIVLREIFPVLGDPIAYNVLDSQEPQEYFKCTVVALFKISSYANIFLRTGQNKNSIHKQEEKAIELIEGLKNAPIFDSMRREKLNQILRLLNSASQYLTTMVKGSKKSSYNNLNEVMIDLAMREKQSFQQCYSELMEKIYNYESNIKRMKDEGTTSLNKYRSYYLLYHFYTKILEDTCGQFIAYFYQQSSKAIKVYERIDSNLQSKITQLLYYLLQDKANMENICQNAWKASLILLLLKVHLHMLRHGIFAERIAEFCARNLQNLVNISSKSESLSHFVLFIKCVSIITLIYRTNVHCRLADTKGQRLMSLIRGNIISKMEDTISKWKQMRCQEKEKFLLFKIFPFEKQTAESNEKFGAKACTQNQRNNSQKITDEMLIKQLQEKYRLIRPQKSEQILKNNEEQADKGEQPGLLQYLKIVMLFSKACSVLNYYREDVMAKSVGAQMFKQNFVDFVQDILRQFASFYDAYFKKSSAESESQNSKIIEEGLNDYTKDPMITKKLNYLNKIMKEVTNFSIPTILEILPRKTERVNNEKSILSALMIYNSIEEMLQSLGFQTTYKFRQNRMSLSHSRKKSMRIIN